METHDPIYEAWFYVGTFFVAALAGFVSTFSDHRSLGFWNILAAGCIGGFVAVAVVGILIGSVGGISNGEPRYLGLAVLVGLTGKQSLKIAYFVMNKLAKQLGMEEKDESQS